jgi:hypothetical protein
MKKGESGTRFSVLMLAASLINNCITRNGKFCTVGVSRALFFIHGFWPMRGGHERDSTKTALPFLSPNMSTKKIWHTDMQ